MEEHKATGGVTIPGMEVVAAAPPRTESMRRTGSEAGVLHADAEAAIAKASQLLKANPKDEDALRMRSSAFAQRGEYDKAIKDYDVLLQSNPNQPELLQSRAHAKQMRGQIASALEDCNKAIELRPTEPAGYITRGMCSAAGENYDQVIHRRWPPQPLRTKRGRHIGGGGVSRTQKHSEAGYGRAVDRGVWTAKTVKRPRQQPAHPQYATYWAPLTRKRHTMPHSAQHQHTNYWAPRTRKRHQQEHRPQRPTESSDPTQHAKGRTGDCPGPRKGTTTRRNVTQGAGGQ